MRRNPNYHSIKALAWGFGYILGPYIDPASPHGSWPIRHNEFVFGLVSWGKSNALNAWSAKQSSVWS